MLSTTNIVKSSIALIVFIALSYFQINAQQISTLDRIDKAVETALLAEDWASVASQLPSETTATQSVVVRLIRGHACLASNRNNDSVHLLKDTGIAADYEKWLAWANKFESIHPTSPLASYFKGDALARL